MEKEIIKKSKLIDEISKKLERRVTKTTIETVFDATLNVISEILVTDGVKKLKEENSHLKLRLYGLGTFYVKKLRSRTYYMPTGLIKQQWAPSEVCLIKKEESLRVAFTISDYLQRKLNKKQVSE